MCFRIDKRFIEILISLGASVTWQQFRTAYNIRRSEREAL